MLTTTRKIFLGIASFFYVVAGSLHFLSPGPYLKIMPPYLPWHSLLVQVSGAAEIAGGLGLLVPRLRRPAAWGLVALLIAVFPANLYMATANIPMGSAPMSLVLLWGRLPLQAVLIWWVLACTQPRLIINVATPPKNSRSTSVTSGGSAA
jgi:uncharacterized membrane protein